MSRTCYTRNLNRTKIASVTTRMSLQVNRLDILSHPYMRREELLGAKLLSLYTAYKKRQAAGIIQFYSDRLIGLEDALLQTRHQLLAMAVLPCSTSHS